MHALIIEPDTFIGWMIEDVLRANGFASFDFACSGEEAVAAAMARCPDLITTEFRIGTGISLEAIQLICSEAAVPIIFITAMAGELRGLRSDAMVVQKPFSGADLNAAVAQVARIGA
jgi:DNA-binding response OmpR family regulator